MEKKVVCNYNLKYHILNSEKLNELIDYIVERTKLHNFSPLEQSIYVHDLLKEYIDVKIVDSYDIKRGISLKCINGNISQISLPFVYSMILNKLNINSKANCIFKFENMRFNITTGKVVMYIDDTKYNLTGVYVNTYDYNYDYLVYEDSPYIKCFKTPVVSQIISNSSLYPRYNYMFDIKFLKDLAKYGIKKIDDKVFTDLNRISLFIDGNMLFPSHGYLNHDEFIKDVLTYYDLEEICDKVDKYHSILDNVIGADEFITALYTVRKVEYLEHMNVEFTTDLLKDVVVSNKLMFDRDVDYELDNIETSHFNKRNKETIDIFISENGWDKEISKIKMYTR